ncbi:membrane integrity-associated transporter subunit PqiC [Pseudoalteromonas luteoviolacea]|uniref:PqiC family protein n=1 Tax=Pseudoalteromonas luteoviolacea TaxID=43657 RepID=UPI001B38F81F|nr:ABC-type transport auxiliary lipoprotein family protein [Pseudoalteromonas luteoviolacea]MBQ4810578.1 membrane integrity-associated transporter subunit PqiC [Pseudoalteromonas luteoviolacea]
MRIFVFLVVLLTGCSSSSTVKYNHYLLPDLVTPTDVGEHYPVMLVETDMADYLNQSGLVFRSSNSEIIYARHHLWAHGISQQIAHKIINSLRAKQSHTWPIGYTPGVKLDETPRLRVHFLRFNGTHTGHAELTGEWLLTNAKGRIIKSKHFAIKVTLKASGYTALVEALSKGIELLTEEIAAELINTKEKTGYTSKALD